MDNKGLLFIPDISGFSKFVSETEINHSRLIIQELLEILINANEIDLEISEIEGDAILFYKFGELPDLNVLYRQVEKMFCAFHRNLIGYDLNRYCQCTACASVASLTLKVITHYGEFTGYNVKNFNKLIGKDIIVAHQLLKNDIPQHEYWLITNSVAGEVEPHSPAKWMTWDRLTKQTDTGEVPFQYTLLSPLRNEIAAANDLPPVLDDKVKVLSLEREYDTDIITLFHAAGDFRYRNKWHEGVKDVELVNHFLPRVGMKCRFVLENGEAFVFSSSYRYQSERIEFSETQESDQSVMYFILQRTAKKKTKLTIDFYRENDLFGKIQFTLLKKSKTEALFKRSMEKLADVVRDLKISSAVD